jgi:spermidine synthase
MAAFALTIFLGAFLLFQVQPLIGKYILPWFGGGPGVWTTCLLFFQVLLLGGYAYAHFSSRWLRTRTQVLVHLALLAGALAFLPIIPADSWKPYDSNSPTLRILALLAACVGLPYFVLSATGPLIQHWFSRTHPGVSPYRLYALSNVGSLLALLSYPFFFETHFTRRAQAALWAWGLAAYGVCCAFCAWKLWRGGSAEWRVTSVDAGPKSKVQSPKSEGVGSQTSSPSPVPRHPSLARALWLALPACASVLLMATTNKMCQEVAVIPFLWVLPLALYLLSFIICFDSPRWYRRFPFTLALIAASAAVAWALFQGNDLSIYKQITVYAGGLFICCMVCHGELYRLRPDPEQLTGFYLRIAAGGALGGVFVAVLAPVLFKDYYELNWGLFLCGLLFLVVCATERRGAQSAPAPKSVPRQPVGWFAHAVQHVWLALRGALRASEWQWLSCLLPFLIFGGLDWFIGRFPEETTGLGKHSMLALRLTMWGLLVFLAGAWVVRGKFRTFQHWHLLACTWLSLGLAALGVTLWMQGQKSGHEVIHRSRNFYGVLTVFEYRKNEPKAHYFELQHGRTTHGIQFADPAQATWPTSYYGEESGVGLALHALPAGPRRIGVVGLGAGTLTAYGKPGDQIRFYEINPEVKNLATWRFTYLSNCAGNVEVALGDARLSLEREPPQQFDLLVLDAFSSDAIPVHLLTKEAFELYGRHLNTNGVIAVHVSNHFLDLEPVVANAARHLNYKMVVMDYDDSEGDWWLYSSTWILLSRSERFLNSPGICGAASAPRSNLPKVPLWTDDFASLFQILK